MLSTEYIFFKSVSAHLLLASSYSEDTICISSSTDLLSIAITDYDTLVRWSIHVILIITETRIASLGGSICEALQKKCQQDIGKG